MNIKSRTNKSLRHLLASVILLACVAPPSANALGILSRACPLPIFFYGVESVTVDWSSATAPIYYMFTSSSHLSGGTTDHTLNSGSGYELNWRSVAGHGYINDIFINNLNVVGQHYIFDPLSNVETYLGSSAASDCNLTNWGVENG